MTCPIDPVEVDTDPKVIRAGETCVDLAWQVSVDNAPVASPWQARCQIRASVGADTVLEEPTCVIADGVVNVPFTADETAAMQWTSGVIGVEVYDDTVSPEVAYRIVQAPIRVDAEVVR